jgi:hypothetical protein
MIKPQFVTKWRTFKIRFINLIYNIFLLYKIYNKNNHLQHTDRFLKSTYIDDYGNTQYSNNVFCTKIENNNEIHLVQSF